MTAEKRVFRDQMGYEVNVTWPPQRIISLVPSQTELLATLQLDERVVGITKFCIHPESWFRTKRRVGGTKKLNMTTIGELQPDLIIGNKEENTEHQIKELMQRYPVWLSDIHNLAGALDMIRNVGKLVDKYDGANELVTHISNNFNKLHTQNIPPVRAAYFIWRDPYMTVGGGSFISSMLRACNFINVFDTTKVDYPVIKPEQLAQAEPQVIFLSSEPFPFTEKHKEEFTKICPGAKVMLVDGEYFSWYGSRLLNTPDYLNSVMEEVHG